uniref:GTP cyclohydrolase 1 n=1 Tax=Bionectria ochroleuca TaxID=29856 RepID=A0A8H7NKU8_BIOOC
MVSIDDAERSLTRKRPHDTASISGSSTSSDGSAHKKKRKEKRNGAKSNTNGVSPARSKAFDKRRNSLGSAARDPRDEPVVTVKSKKKAKAAAATTQSDAESETTPSSVVDFDGLSRPSIGTLERREESPEQAKKRLEKMRGAVRTLLECVGEDADREGLLDTPERYAKALLFLTKGYQESMEDLVNGALFHEGHNELIVVKNIEIHSLCEHHLVPFIGKMHIGYIPSQTVIGLSKLPRIAEMFARRLQIQERLTKEVAHAIMEILKPQGVAVVMESSHLCMVMRGVEKTSSTTITSCVLGCFERKSKTRNEFLSLVGVNR